MKKISLTFDGYWREKHKAGIPAESGIYVVYVGTYLAESKTASLRKVLYIGESENVQARLSNHERLSDWEKYVNPGETLYYSFAGVSQDDRVRAEAAMIYQHQPPCNKEYTSSFPFATTTITTSGKNSMLKSSFTV